MHCYLSDCCGHFIHQCNQVCVTLFTIVTIQLGWQTHLASPASDLGLQTIETIDMDLQAISNRLKRFVATYILKSSICLRRGLTNPMPDATSWQFRQILAIMCTSGAINCSERSIILQYSAGQYCWKVFSCFFGHCDSLNTLHFEVCWCTSMSVNWVIISSGNGCFTKPVPV